MVDLASLARRARASEDGESYLAIAKEPGFRIGMGARTSRRHDPDFFVEVVLNPFPDRPGVDPGHLEAQARLLKQLRDRGYALSCDDGGVVTCERVMARTAASEETAEISTLLNSSRPGS